MRVVLTMGVKEEGVNVAGHTTRGIVNTLETPGKPLNTAVIFNCLNPGYTPVAAVFMLIEEDVGKVRYVFKGGLSLFSSARVMEAVVIP